MNGINKIAFTKKNGYCPYYILDNSKSLYRDVKQFTNCKQAVEFIKAQIDGKPFKYFSFSDFEIWETVSKIYVLDGKGKVIIRETPTVLSYHLIVMRIV
ncbi:MAG: hypothetical protein M1609_02395 [Firmicutes bacterium]|nr:hypothetical protein [Bacillota bacterium]